MEEIKGRKVMMDTQQGNKLISDIMNKEKQLSKLKTINE